MTGGDLGRQIVINAELRLMPGDGIGDVEITVDECDEIGEALFGLDGLEQHLLFGSESNGVIDGLRLMTALLLK